MYHDRRSSFQRNASGGLAGWLVREGEEEQKAIAASIIYRVSIAGMDFWRERGEVNMTRNEEGFTSEIFEFCCGEEMRENVWRIGTVSRMSMFVEMRKDR